MEMNSSDIGDVRLVTLSGSLDTGTSAQGESCPVGADPRLECSAFVPASASLRFPFLNRRPSRVGSIMAGWRTGGIP